MQTKAEREEAVRQNMERRLAASEHVHEFDLVRTRFVCRKCGYILRPPKEAKP